VGVLLFVELTLQAFYYFTAGSFLFARAALPMWAPNPWSGVFNRPHLALTQRTSEFAATYYTDGAGLRVASPGAEVTRDKPPSTYRVMLLGPSFAFGWGVDYGQSLAARLQDALQQGGFAAGRRVEVVDAGVNSLPPAPHLEWYRHVGAGYGPDLVVQLAYGSLRVGNDPRPGVHADARGYLVRDGSARFQWLRRAARSSATVFYAWVVATRLGGAWAPRGEHEITGAGRALSEATRFDPQDPANAPALAYYRALAATVRAGGGEVLVVYFPLSAAVHPEDRARWRLQGVRDAGGQEAFNAAFCDHLTRQGIPCLDVTADLRRAAPGGHRLYYRLDVHWTPEGNDVVARAVAARLLH